MEGGGEGRTRKAEPVYGEVVGGKKEDQDENVTNRARLYIRNIGD